MTRRRFLKTAAATAVGAMLPRHSAGAAGDPLARLDAVAQADLVRRGEASAVELIDAAIRRIEALNPRLNAFVTFCFDRAREHAKRARPRGPFGGVPYAIKDLADYEGLRCTLGSRLFEWNISRHNDGVVERALAAGLIPLGKTNTSEFGLLPTTESLLLGPARNPWDLERSPGGSSGGAAAAVAAGMVPLAHASDGGGSIRNPASCCGVFGLKPSRGRIYDTRRQPPGEIAVSFAVSRSVRDSARLFAACEHRGPSAPLLPVGEVTGPSRRRLRIALTTHAPTGARPHPEVERVIEKTAQLCQDLGHTVIPAPHPIDGEEFAAHFLAIWAAIPSLIRRYAWMVGLRQFRLVRAASVLEPWTIGLAEWLRRRPPDAVERAVAYCKSVGDAYGRFFEKYDVQLLPVLRRPPILTGEQAPEVPFDTLLERVIDYCSYTPPYNAAGAPAMSVPLFMSSDGLPIGSQFGARLGDERTLFELAYELEEAQPWANRWPPTSAAAVT